MKNIFKFLLVSALSSTPVMGIIACEDCKDENKDDKKDDKKASDSKEAPKS